ncbi:hypothetical protein [Arsenophonus endosymbiont of Aleurodicus floccissimus]|nr:hypothetical protein [Arsenophonus endosymbiont of Aleurodicus floccissimus]
MSDYIVKERSTWRIITLFTCKVKWLFLPFFTLRQENSIQFIRSILTQ